MLYNNVKLEAEPTANEATFRQFVDTILARKPIELSANDNDEAIAEALKNSEANIEKQINDSTIVKIGAEAVPGRGVARFITLVEGDKVNKYVLWPVVTSEDGITKVGLRSYNTENINEGIEIEVKPEELLDVFMTIAAYFLMEG